MNIAAIIGELQSCGVRFTVERDRLHIDAPKGVVTPDQLRVLKEQRGEAVSWLRNEIKALQGMLLSEFAGAGMLVEVESQLLGETVYFASDKAAARGAPEGVAVYLPDELRVVAGLDSHSLKAVHRLKHRFNGAITTPAPLQAQYNRLLAREKRGEAYPEGCRHE